MTVTRQTTFIVVTVAFAAAAAAAVAVAVAVATMDGAAADGAAADGGTVHESSQTDQEVRDYWTPERMAEAEPAMPLVDPGSLEEAEENTRPEGAPGGVEGQPGR